METLLGKRIKLRVNIHGYMFARKGSIGYIVGIEPAQVHNCLLYRVLFPDRNYCGVYDYECEILS